MIEEKDLIFTDEEMKTTIILPAPDDRPKLTDEIMDWLYVNEPGVLWAPRFDWRGHKLVFRFPTEKGALHFKMRFG